MTYIIRKYQHLFQEVLDIQIAIKLKSFYPKKKKKKDWIMPVVEEVLDFFKVKLQIREEKNVLKVSHSNRI